MIMGLLEPIVAGFSYTETMILYDENGVPYSVEVLNDCEIKVSIMDEDCCRPHLSTTDVTILDAGTIEFTFPTIGLCQGRYALVIDVTLDDEDPERIVHLTLPVTRN